LGFAPSRVLHRKPCPGFRPDSSLTLCESDAMSCDVATDTPASRSLDRLTTGPFLTATANCDAGKGRPFEGFCTGSVPRIQTNYPRAMRSPPIVSCITADQPMRFGGTSSPYRSCRDRLRCRAFCDLTNARGALQSIRFGCSTVSVTTAGRPLVGLAARSEFLTRRRIALIG
jgi:hypothetical protein